MPNNFVVDRITGLESNQGGLNLKEINLSPTQDHAPLMSTFLNASQKDVANFQKYYGDGEGGPTNFGSNQAMQYGFGEQQPWYDKFGNAIIKFIPDALAKTAQAIGHTAGFMSFIGNGVVGNHDWGSEAFKVTYDNWLVNAAAGAQEQLGEALPIHLQRDYAEGNFWDKLTTADFWAKDAGDAFAFLASFYLPQAAIMRSAGALSNLAKIKGLTKTASIIKGAGWGGAYVNSILSESGFEGKQTFDSVYQNILEQKINEYKAMGYDDETAQQLGDETAKQIAGNSAANTVAANAQLLLLSNLWEMKAFFPNYGKEVKDIARAKYMNAFDSDAAEKLMRPNYLKGIGQGILAEGFWEEGMQTAVGAYELKKAQGYDPASSSFIGNYFGEYFKGLADTDQQTAIFLGGLIGGIFGGIATKRDAKAEQQKYQDAEQLLNYEKRSMAVADNSFDDYLSEKYNFEAPNPDGTPSINLDKLGKVSAMLVNDYEYVGERIRALLKGDKMQVEFLDKKHIGEKLFSYLNSPLFSDTNEAFDEFNKVLDTQTNEFTSKYGDQFSNIGKEELEASKAFTKELKEAYDQVFKKAPDLIITGSETEVERKEKSLAIKTLMYETIKDKTFSKFLSELQEQTELDPGEDPGEFVLTDPMNYLQEKKDYDSAVKDYKEKKERYDNRINKEEDLKTLIDDSRKLQAKLKDKTERKKLIDEYGNVVKQRTEIAKRYFDIQGKEFKTLEDRKNQELITFEYEKLKAIEGFTLFDKYTNPNAQTPAGREKQESILNPGNLGIRNSFYVELVNSQVRNREGIKKIESVLSGLLSEVESNIATQTFLENHVTIVENIKKELQTILNDILSKDGWAKHYTIEEVKELQSLFSKFEEELVQMQNNLIGPFVDEEFDAVFNLEPSATINILNKSVDGDVASIQNSLQQLAINLPSDDADLLTVYRNTLLFTSELRDLEYNLTKEIDRRSAEAVESSYTVDNYLQKKKTSSLDEMFEERYLKTVKVPKAFYLFSDIEMKRMYYGDNSEQFLTFLNDNDKHITDYIFSLKVLLDYYADKPAFENIHKELSKLYDYFEALLPAIAKAKGVRKFAQKKSNINIRQNLWRTLGINLEFNADKNELEMDSNDDLITFHQELSTLLSDNDQYIRNLVGNAGSEFDNVKIIDTDEKGLNFNPGHIYRLFETINESKNKEKIKKLLEDRKNKIVEQLKTITVKEVSKNPDGSQTLVAARDGILTQNYLDNPKTGFNEILHNFSKSYANEVKFAPEWFESPIYNFFRHGSVDLLEADLKRLQASRELSAGGFASIETVSDLVTLHKHYLAASELLDVVTHKQYNVKELVDELKKDVENEVIVPNFQQINAIKEILDFYNNKDQLFAYLSGIAGTGKSKVVTKYVVETLKLSGDKVLALSYSDKTSENIKEAIDSKKDTKTVYTLTSDDLKDLSLLIVDEFDAFTTSRTAELRLLMDAVKQDNASRLAAKKPLLKVLLLGDYTQIKREMDSSLPLLENILMNTQYIQNNTEKLGAKKIKRITPLSIAYRSDVSEIPAVASQYQHKLEKVEQISSKVSGAISDPNAKGVQFVKFDGNIPSGFMERFKAAENSSRKKTVIVGSKTTEDKYLKYKTDNNLDYDVISYEEAHGLTLEEVYVDIKPEDIPFTEARPATYDFNTAMYTAISRGQSYVMVATYATGMETKIDSTILEIEKDNKKEKDELKQVINQYLTDLLNSYEGNELTVVESKATKTENEEATKEEPTEPEFKEVVETEITDVATVEELPQPEEEDETPEVITLIQTAAPLNDTTSPTVTTTSKKEFEKKEPLKKGEKILNINSPSYKPIKNETVKPGQEVFFVPGQSKNGESAVGIYSNTGSEYTLLGLMLENKLSQSTSEISEMVKNEISKPTYSRNDLELTETLNQAQVLKRRYQPLDGYKVHSVAKQKYHYSDKPLNISPLDMVEHIQKAFEPIMTSANNEQYFKEIKVTDVFILTTEIKKSTPLLQYYPGDITEDVGQVFIKVDLVAKTGETQVRYVKANARQATVNDSYINTLVTFYDSVKDLKEVLSKYKTDIDLNTKEFNGIVDIFRNDFTIARELITRPSDNSIYYKVLMKPNKNKLSAQEISKQIEERTGLIIQNKKELKAIQELSQKLIPIVYRGELQKRRHSTETYKSFIQREVNSGKIDAKEAKKFFDLIDKIRSDAEEQIFQSYEASGILLPAKFVTTELVNILLHRQRINNNLIIKELRSRGIDPASLPVTLFYKDPKTKHDGGFLDNFREIISKNSFIPLKDGSGYYAYDPLHGDVVKVNKIHPKKYVSKQAYEALNDPEFKREEVMAPKFMTKNSPLYNATIVFAKTNDTLGNINLIPYKSKVKTEKKGLEVFIAPYLFESGLLSGDSKSTKYIGSLRYSFNKWIEERTEDVLLRGGDPATDPSVNFNSTLVVTNPESPDYGKILQSRDFEGLRNKNWVNKLDSTQQGIDLAKKDLLEVLEKFMVEQQVPLFYHSKEGAQQVSSLEELEALSQDKRQSISSEDLAPMLDKANRNADGTFKTTTKLNQDGSKNIIKGGPFLSLDRLDIEDLSKKIFSDNPINKENNLENLFSKIDVRILNSKPSSISISKQVDVKQEEPTENIDTIVPEEVPVFTEEGELYTDNPIEFLADVPVNEPAAPIEDAIIITDDNKEITVEQVEEEVYVRKVRSKKKGTSKTTAKKKIEDLIEKEITVKELEEVASEENITTEEAKALIVTEVQRSINNEAPLQKLGKALQKAINKILSLFLTAGLLVNTAFINPTNVTAFDTSVGTTIESLIKDSSYDTLTEQGKQVYVKQLVLGKKHIIIDKPLAKAFLYNEKGVLIKDFPVLLGKTVGDETTQYKKVATTTSGEFKLQDRNFKNDEIYKGKIYALTMNTPLAIHITYPKEIVKRTAALNSESIEDNRMSWGCINVSEQMWNNYISPNFKAGDVITITSDNQSPTTDLTDADKKPKCN